VARKLNAKAIEEKRSKQRDDRAEAERERQIKRETVEETAKQQHTVEIKPDPVPVSTDTKKIKVAAYVRVQEAIAAYRSEADVFGTFIVENTVQEDDARLSTSELYALYTVWAKDNGYRPLNNKNFVGELRRHMKSGVPALSAIWLSGCRLIPTRYRSRKLK